MNSALYAITYSGSASFGGGAIFIGNGKIVGIDVGNMRYHGNYTIEGMRLKAKATMSAPTGGTLVTGQQLPAGTKLQLTADWPIDFANGAQQTIMVEGRPVQVVFEKLDEV